ncbi:MAG: AraC family transcriptional regulator [Muribaculaceae bacterium]|nr:AraC family transcriptional regulator [Muribaculaceae bacterium]
MQNLNKHKILLFLAVAVIALITGVTFQRCTYFSNKAYWQKEGVRTDSIYREGMKYKAMQMPDSALARLVRLKELYTPELPDSADRICVKGLHEAGVIYFQHVNDYKNAFDCLTTSMEIAEQNGLYDQLAAIYIDLAMVYYVFRDVDTAISLTIQGFDTAKKNGDTDLMLRAVNNIIIGGFDIGDFSALDSILEQYRSNIISDAVLKQFTDCMIEAAKLYEQRRYNDAVRILDQCISIIEHIPEYERQKVAAISVKTLILQNQEKYREAISVINNLRDKSIRQEHADMEISYLQFLTRLYYQAGNSDSSTYYALKYINLAESLFGSRAFGNIKDVESNRRIVRADKQIRLLQLENSFNKRLLLFFGLTVLVVSTLLVLIMRQKRTLRSRNEELFRKNEEFMREIETERERRTAMINMETTSPSDSLTPVADIKTEEVDGNEEQPDESMIRLAERITNVMETNEEVLQESFSVDRLAELVESSQKKVSRTLNVVLGKNFPTYLGEVRVREACRRLTDFETYGQYTLESIANSCGFRSRTNFVSVFKKSTGLTPSEYRKIAQNRSKH